jgi:murein DD-endopeptidase MepM/ murein hydrolase activator NlpD
MDGLPLGSPLDTLVVSSNFGSRKNSETKRWEYHPGLDFYADWRDTVYATGAGIVEKSQYNNGYGRTIVIGHVSGYKSRYAHLTRYFVKRGDLVKRGDPIGTAGNTGYSRGYHLHYEVSRYGKHTNPKEYIRL